MKRVSTALLACAITSCGSEFNLPFSNANPTLPSNIQIGAGDRGTKSHSATAAPGPQAGPRNIGTQVWLVPVPAGDVMELARHPESWTKAAGRVDVVSFYAITAYDHPGFECGTPCGPNNYQALVKAVPGGVFKWMGDRFTLAMEAGSIKPYACNDEDIISHANFVIRSLDNVVAAGARISYISLDEPFASGVNTELFGAPACGITPAEVARLQRIYNDRIHAVHPEVVIGFIEPYSGFSADQIISFLLELEHANVPIPFFHLDWYQPGTVREQNDTVKDVGRIRDFCRARGIPFGVIIWGEDGTSNEAFSAGSITTARVALQAVGVTEHTVLQSWAEDPPGQLNSLKHKPDTVPESKAGTHTWLVNWTLEYFKVQPAR